MCVCVCAEIVQQACWRRLLVYSLIVQFVWERVTERSVVLIILPHIWLFWLLFDISKAELVVHTFHFLIN